MDRPTTTFGASDVGEGALDSSNFRFELGDLPCSRVTKIGSFSMKQKIIKRRTRMARTPGRVTVKAEIPNIKLTIVTQDVHAWADWHKSFVIDGKCTDSREMRGAISSLSVSRKTILGQVWLSKACVRSVRPLRRGSRRTPVQFIAELSVGGMTVHDRASTRRR